MPGDTGDQNGNDNRKPASRAAPAGRRVNRRRLRPDPRPGAAAPSARLPGNPPRSARKTAGGVAEAAS